MKQAENVDNMKLHTVYLVFSLLLFLSLFPKYSLACNHENRIDDDFRMGEICTNQDHIQWQARLISPIHIKHEIKNTGVNPTAFFWKKPGLLVSADKPLDSQCVAYREEFGSGSGPFVLDDTAPIEVRRSGHDHPANAFVRTPASLETSAEISCDDRNQAVAATLRIFLEDGRVILGIKMLDGTRIAASASAFSLSQSDIMSATDDSNLIFASLPQMLANNQFQFSLSELNQLAGRDLTNDNMFILGDRTEYYIPLTSNIIFEGPLIIYSRSNSLQLAVSVRP